MIIWVTVANNSPSQDSRNPDVHFQSRFIQTLCQWENNPTSSIRHLNITSTWQRKPRYCVEPYTIVSHVVLVKRSKKHDKYGIGNACHKGNAVIGCKSKNKCSASAAFLCDTLQNENVEWPNFSRSRQSTTRADTNVKLSCIAQPKDLW